MIGKKQIQKVMARTREKSLPTCQSQFLSLLSFLHHVTDLSHTCHLPYLLTQSCSFVLTSLQNANISTTPQVCLIT